MNDCITLQDPKVTVFIRRHSRAKRMTLRISSRDGKAKLSVPIGTPMAQIRQFVHTQTLWLARHSTAKQKSPLGFGDFVHFNGVLHELHQGAPRGTRIQNGVITIAGPTAKINAQLRALFKQAARDQIIPIAQISAAKLHRDISGFSFRDPETRWGSCSSQGRLMFSWRLVMAPIAVQTYVAVHEACHLVEMNHSARFWDLIKEQLPDYKLAQSWLRNHGRMLQGYAL